MKLILQNIPKIESELKCTIMITPETYELDFDHSVFSDEWQYGGNDFLIATIKFLVSRDVIGGKVSVDIIAISNGGYTEKYRTQSITVANFKAEFIKLVKTEI